MLLRKDVIRPGVYLPADGEPRKVTQEEINRWVENHKKLTEKGYHVPLFMTHPRQDERHSWPVKADALEDLKNDPWFLGTVKGYSVDKDGVLQVEYDEDDERRAKKLMARNAAVSPQFGPWTDPDDPSSKWDGIIGHIAVTKKPVNKNQKDRFEAVTEKVLAFGLPDHVCVFGLDDYVPAQFSFNESDHPREPGGSAKGGQFTSKKHPGKSVDFGKHQNAFRGVTEHVKRSHGATGFRRLTASQYAEKAMDWHAASGGNATEFNKEMGLKPKDNRSLFGEAAKAYYIAEHQPERFDSRSDVLATYEDMAGDTRRYRVATRKEYDGDYSYGVYDTGEGTEEHEITPRHENEEDAKSDLANHLHRIRDPESVKVTDAGLEKHHARLRDEREKDKQRDLAKEAEIQTMRNAAAREHSDAKAGFDAIEIGKFKKQKIKLAGLDESVDAQVSGQFGVDKRPGGSGYAVTHIPTGMALGFVSRLDDAKRFAVLAGMAGDWTATDPKKLPKDTMEVGKAVAKAMKTGDYRYIAHLIGGKAKSLKVEQMGEDEMPSRRKKVQQFDLFPVDDMPGKKKKSALSKKPVPGTPKPESNSEQPDPTDQEEPEDEEQTDEQDEEQDSEDGEENEDEVGDSLGTNGSVSKKASDLVSELLKKLPGDKVLDALMGLLQSVKTGSGGDGDADDKDPDSIESAPITVQMGDDEMAGEADKNVDKTKELETKVQQFGKENALLKRQVLELKLGEHDRNKAGILADIVGCENAGQITKVDADAMRQALSTVQFSEDDKHKSVTQPLADKVKWHQSLPKGTFWSDAEKVQQFGVETHDVSKGGFFSPENDRELSAEELEATCKAFNSGDYSALDSVGKK